MKSPSLRSRHVSRKSIETQPMGTRLRRLSSEEIFIVDVTTKRIIFKTIPKARTDSPNDLYKRINPNRKTSHATTDESSRTTTKTKKKLNSPKKIPATPEIKTEFKNTTRQETQARPFLTADTVLSCLSSERQVEIQFHISRESRILKHAKDNIKQEAGKGIAK